MKKLEFGQKLNCTSELQRIRTAKHAFWRAYPCDFNGCIFLGYRTIKNGERHFDSDYSYYFCQKQTIKVMLVCKDANSNPFYSLVGDIDFNGEYSFDTRKLANTTENGEGNAKR